MTSRNAGDRPHHTERQRTGAALNKEGTPQTAFRRKLHCSPSGTEVGLMKPHRQPTQSLERQLLLLCPSRTLTSTTKRRKNKQIQILTAFARNLKQETHAAHRRPSSPHVNARDCVTDHRITESVFGKLAQWARSSSRRVGTPLAVGRSAAVQRSAREGRPWHASRTGASSKASSPFQQLGRSPLVNAALR